MMETFIDLHLHSLYSDDGEFTPTELVQQCKQAGIRVMAIADHNCVRANAEAQKEAERLNIRYIPAIEMDCTYRHVNLHVLGYQIHSQSQDFAVVEENMYHQEISASRERLKLTRQLGFELTENELAAAADQGYWKSVWPGEVFAEVLLKKPQYQNDGVLKPYRQGGARGDNPYVNFYWDYYAQGKPCYVKIEYPSLQDTLSLIHRNGGKAVLAHPGHSLKNRFSLFDEMIPLGMDGVEAFSSYHTPSASYHFYQIAREHALLITCGSDYHGKTKPSIQLGESGCFVDPQEITCFCSYV